MRLQADNYVQHKFDCYCKKVLKYKARDYCRKMKRRGAREVSLSELSEQGLAKLSGTDEYFKGACSFHVLGHDITVSDGQMAKALSVLSADRRDIILLSYFLDMTDREIAERLNLVRRTVAYRRASSLRKLKKSWRETPMSETGKNASRGLLPFTVIAAAVGGDIGAINKVLKHYEGYIITLSKRRVYDEYGSVRLSLDEGLRRELETWLITKILQFDLGRAA
jgi:RNA polymerase sigma factor (sigma-70 family)